MKTKTPELKDEMKAVLRKKFTYSCTCYTKKQYLEINNLFFFFTLGKQESKHPHSKQKGG